MSNANPNSNSPGRRSVDTRPSSRPTVRLDYERNSGRRLGFLGFSVVAHMAFLTALALSPPTIKPIQEIGGGDGLAAGTGSGSEISIVEVDDAGQPISAAAAEAQLTAPTEAPATLVDETSTITAAPVPAKMPPKTPVTAKPKQNKSAENKIAPVVAPVVETSSSDTMTEQQVATETQPIVEETPEAPVLLANPPEDKHEQTETAEPEVAAVAAVAETQPTIDEPQKEEPATEPEPQPEATNQQVTPVAVVQKSEVADEAQAEPATAAGNSDTQSGIGNADSGTGSTQETKGTGSGTVIAGPIRDASELKALPGNPNPAYPERDRFNRKQGTSVILGRVMPDGRIGQVVLEKSSGSPTMDSESAKTFRNWRFQPGQQGWVRKPFQFRLVGEAKEVPAELGKQLKRQ